MNLPRFFHRTTAAVSIVMAIGANSAFFPSAAFAGDPATDEIQRAYAPYRAALFRTNSNSQAEALQAITQAQQAWRQVIAKFGQKAPAPYDRDTSFAASLAKVGSIYDKAAGEIQKNQLPQAHETLEEARDVLGELRRRNQVVVFSDHMNTYHAEMEHVLTDGPKLLGESGGLLQLAGKVGTLEFLARRLGQEAPAELAGNEEFITASRAVEKSVADLKAALLKQDIAAVKEAIGKLKGPYSRMFLRYG